MPSAVIQSFDYRPERRELLVTFTTGRRYLYSQVPPELAEAFRLALSKGRFFNLRIRDDYDYRELGPEVT
jgi:KTSC domain